MKSFSPLVLATGLLLAACGEEPAGQASPPVTTPQSAAAPAGPTSALSCISLMRDMHANATITGAQIVPAGTFSPPDAGPPGPGADFSALPEFCRVTGSIQFRDERNQPTGTSDIRFEAWLPTTDWNGRFMQTGNGGAAGSIVHGSMAGPLMRGYAVANTDTGHQGGGGDYSWALGNPERVTDHAWRAVHELTLAGKAITRAHYGSDAEKSYFVGCSTGGRQGLMEAQRFPDDYDAIVAGAPASNWNRLMALSIVIGNNMGDGGLGVDKLGLLKQAAVASCDSLDGVEDGVITAVAACDFDPGSLQCTDGQTGQCLAEEEVEAARRIYAGVVDGSGATLFPGTGYGSEPLWGAYASPGFAIGASFFRHVVLEDPQWDASEFDPGTHLSMLNPLAESMVAMDPDLSAFFDNGGKLITYHGTTDGLIPYGNSVDYFESMLDTLGEEAVNDSARLYLVYGMNHCAGGDGAHAVDWLSAMEAWVEEGEAPGALAGTHPAPPPGAPGAEDAREFTRPLCPYPAMPVYDGSGDPDDAASFSCTSPD